MHGYDIMVHFLVLILYKNRRFVTSEPALQSFEGVWRNLKVLVVSSMACVCIIIKFLILPNSLVCLYQAMLAWWAIVRTIYYIYSSNI